jgi:hypothetical protein
VLRFDVREFESSQPRDIGERSVVRSTATLACIGRCQDYFREEFVSTLCHRVLRAL